MTPPPAPGLLVVANPADLDPIRAGGRLGRLAAGWLLGYGSPHTRRAYARDLAGWACWCDEVDVDPLAADRVHVDAWARHLSEGLALAPAAAARRLAAVSAFYRWCVLEQYLTTNPAVHVRRPEVDPDASTTLGLSTEHARSLLAAATEHSPRMAALVALLLVDGLRISEALGLDVDDVRDVDRGHRIVDLRRKGGRTARAALPPVVADAVDTYLARRDVNVVLGVLAGPLFVTRGTGNGRRCSRPGPRRSRPGAAGRSVRRDRSV